MSSFSRPSTPPAPMFTPVNRQPLKGLTIGYHDGVAPAAMLDQLNALQVPLLCRMPVVNQAQAQAQLNSLLPYPNLSGLILLENEVDGPHFTIDHAKMWGVQLFNETDLLGWSPALFEQRTLLYHEVWRNAGFTKKIVSGGIYSVEANDGNTWHANAYLTTLLKSAPKDLVIDVHWYGDSSDQWKARLKSLTSGFEVSVSEYGKPSRNAQEEHNQVGYLASKDCDFYAFGALFTCVYQAASGASASNLDNYGVFRLDNSAKPALDCLGQRP